MATKAEINSKANQLAERLTSLCDALELKKLNTRLEELAQITAEESFWNDREKAQSTLKEQDRAQKTVEILEKTRADLNEVQEFVDITDNEDEEMLKDLFGKLDTLENTIYRLEFKRMFSHEADPNNAILQINSGAGGTEAQDWVSMLLRQYSRWAERNDMRVTLVDSLPGEEAGYKNVTITVEGDYAYGYLKAENGIHRLVRISPFDANSRRHTSFASVFVTPEVSQDINIEINEADIRVDTYRASGAGGQHINKTDSAVRMTHLPTGIVVQCQNERSQHKNRATAMKLLKSKLYELELEKREQEMDKMHSQKKEIAWGSQIRSYVLHPYRLVKDHRTNLEIGNVDAVLDGAIDPFIEAYLMKTGAKS